MIKDTPWLFIGLFLGALAGCLALAWLGRKHDSSPKNRHLQETSSTSTGPVDRHSYAVSVVTDAPTVYYRLNESGGSVAHDSSGHAIDGAYSDPVLGRGQDTGVELSGDANVVSAPPLAAMTGNHDRTVELWIKTTQTGRMNLVDAGLQSKGHAFDFELIPDGGPGGCGNPCQKGFMVSFWGSAVNFTTDNLNGLDLTDGAWHYLAATVSNGGSTVNVIVDGQEPKGWIWNDRCYRASAEGQPFIMPTAAKTIPTKIAFAHSGDTWPYHGYMEEIAIYPTALSADQLRKHFSTGSRPTIKNSIHDRPAYSMAQWKECLGLTDSQYAKFQDAMKSHQKNVTRSILKQAAEAAAKLIIDTVAKHDAVAADQASLKTLSEPLIKEQAEFIERVNSFLTPAQQAEFARMLDTANSGGMLTCPAK